MQRHLRLPVASFQTLAAIPFFYTDVLQQAAKDFIQTDAAINSGNPGSSDRYLSRHPRSPYEPDLVHPIVSRSYPRTLLCRLIVALLQYRHTLYVHPGFRIGRDTGVFLHG